MNHITAMKQALEALEELNINASDYDFGPAYEGAKQRRKTAITSLRQAIAEAEKQEPVAWRAPNWGHSPDEFVYRDFDDPVLGVDGKPSPNNEPLFTHPQPKREPLTNANPLLVFAKECVLGAYPEDELADAAFKAIEAAHGIKGEA